MSIGYPWVHRKEQWDLKCWPLLCVHWRTPNRSKRVFDRGGFCDDNVLSLALVVLVAPCVSLLRLSVPLQVIDIHDAFPNGLPPERLFDRDESDALSRAVMSLLHRA